MRLIYGPRAIKGLLFSKNGSGAGCAPPLLRRAENAAQYFELPWRKGMLPFAVAGAH